MNQPSPLGAPPAGQRTGKWMLYLAWIGALAVLTWFFADLESDRTNPNRAIATRIDASGVAEVTLRQNRGGHYVVSGAINGVPAVFLLDTGATHVSVPAALARKAGLPRLAPARFSTANGTVDGYLSEIDSLELGDIRFTGVRADINPHMRESTVLLGMSALRDIEFVQRGRELTLRIQGATDGRP